MPEVSAEPENAGARAWCTDLTLHRWIWESTDRRGYTTISGAPFRRLTQTTIHNQPALPISTDPCPHHARSSSTGKISSINMFSSVLILPIMAVFATLGAVAAPAPASAATGTATCPKPTIDVPSGPVNPLVISGEATAPCGLLYVYLNGSSTFVAGASGPSYEDGAPLTFSYQNDLILPYGDVRVKVRSTDGWGVWADSWSDEVVIEYRA